MSTPTTISRNLWVALLLLTASGGLVCLYFGLPVEFSLLGLFGAGLCLYLAARCPELFLVAAIFAPQWKNYGVLRSLDQAANLTIVVLALLVAGLLWRVLGQLGGMQHWNLRALFFRQVRPVLAFLLFAVVISATYLYTTGPDYGASKLGRFWGIGGIFFLAPFLLILTEKDLGRFALLFLTCSEVTAILLITHLEARAQNPDQDITRIGAGWLMGMAILLVLFYPFFRTKFKQILLFVFTLPLLIAGLIASAARGPFVSLSFAVLVGLLVWLAKGRVRLRTAAMIVAVLALSAVASYLSLRQADVGKYSAKATELFQLVTGGEVSGSAAQRLVFYRTTLEAIPNHLLFGRGIGSWPVFYYGQDRRDYPHNLILEVTFEEGLMGLTALFIFLAATGHSIYRMLRASSFEYFVLALMVFYCLEVSMFSGDLDDNRLIWLWIGISLAVCRFVALQRRYQTSFRTAFVRVRSRTRPVVAQPAYSTSLELQRSLREKRGPVCL